MIIDQTKTLPHVGQRVTIAGWEFEIVDMDGKRIDKILVSKTTSNADSDPEATL